MLDSVKINLNNLQNKACSHWSEFKHLVTIESLNYIERCPRGPLSLVSPNCPVSSAIAGLVLGDATVRPYTYPGNSYLRLNLGSNLRSLSYIATVACFLEHIGLGNGLIFCYKNGINSDFYHFTVLSKRHVMWNEVRDFWYCNHTKTVPKNVHMYISDFGFALWVLGDGSRANLSKHPGLILHTQNFTKAEQKLLASALSAQFGLTFGVDDVISRGKLYHVLRSRKIDAPVIKQLILRYMHQSWHYKLTT
uniref:LAGLIDADG DNA endonuclease n=1 Tax=Chlamydomonas reinhardtii TaxID=3055 RepID=B2XYB6_CHLRE|nr:LAGLIDADG DNA endonuclease [Chlamydomonas reinhardtii]ABX82856.1 LAGLIDADG DNA endonuclease [Chlamydomonas reinhardtii]